ncbi:MAG TPA: hypothetical protein VKS81_01260 [Bacteroidota bacterium]|nr:hypothetical protein [Bacteroidota bacterium]
MFSFALASIPGPSSDSLDIAIVAKDNVVVKLDNEHIRVMEITLPAHSVGPLHWHPGHAVYYLTEAHLRNTPTDGAPILIDVKPGDTTWTETVTHVTENLGANVAHFIMIEIRSAKR